MNSPQILSIAPRIRPVTDGIGDYGLALASALRRLSGIETEFIVGDPSWDGPSEVEGFAVRRVSSRTERELLALLRSSDERKSLLLHYEGYGYATRGCPLWLVAALEQWKRAADEQRLVTIFHELYATGPPWRSSFWLSPLQKRVVRRLVRLSDQCLTSLGQYGMLVRKLGPGTEAETRSLPVFSSIGEPADAPPLRERSKRLVVFGTRGRRIEVYRRSAADLNRICRKLGITEIIDIGRPVDFDISSVIDVPVVMCGELPGADVSRLMLDSIAGVIDYPATFLGKSTIFAAYCAHRMIPVVASPMAGLAAEGLEAGRHYWLANDESEELSFDNGQAIADNTFAWYQAHNLSRHAEALAVSLHSNERPAKRTAQPIG